MPSMMAAVWMTTGWLCWLMPWSMMRWISRGMDRSMNDQRGQQDQRQGGELPVGFNEGKDFFDLVHIEGFTLNVVTTSVVSFHFLPVITRVVVTAILPLIFDINERPAKDFHGSGESLQFLRVRSSHPGSHPGPVLLPDGIQKAVARPRSVPGGYCAGPGHSAVGR